MIKRGRILLISSLILIISITSALAVSVTYTYPSLTNINSVVYKISDNSKISDYNSGTGNTITISYQGSSPSTEYYTYHYKQGYLPFMITSNTDGSIYNIIKQSSCKLQIASVNIPSTANTNEQITITVNLNDITSVFPDLVLPSYIPTELEEYYKADANVKLYIDDILKETKTIKISTSNNNIQFTTSISTAGSHNVKIETEITDDQCSNFINPQTSLATVTITSPTNTTTPTEIPNICKADNECKKDKSVCTSGDVDCTCSQLTGDLCSSNEICLTPGVNLSHNQPTLGTCCSTICIPKLETCSVENQKESCLADENGCMMFRECKSEHWTTCEKVDPLCLSSSDCEDGTPAGSCSSTNPGKACIGGQLIVKLDLCSDSEDTNTTCQELWDCINWIEYPDYKICNQWADKNDCNTWEHFPENQTLQYPLTYQTAYEQYQKTGVYDEGTFYGTPLSQIGANPQDKENSENVVSSILNKFLALPRSFSVKTGLELPILMLVVAIVLASFFLYAMNRKQNPIIIKQEKEVKKTKTSPVKVNDLLLSVIESLKGDERRIVDTLVEQEGITVEELRKKLGLTKTKMDIALQKLERRQIIKERKDYDSGIFFNDWMK